MSGERKIAIGPLTATIGAVLVIVSLFLDWYEGFTGWTIYEVVDLVLLGLAMWTIFSFAPGLGIVLKTVSPRIALVATIATLVIVATHVVNDPPAVAGDGGPDRDIGIWLGLAGAALMVAGAVLATTRISLAVEARRRDESPAAEPSPAPPKEAPPGEPTVPLPRTEQPRGGAERP